MTMSIGVQGGKSEIQVANLPIGSRRTWNHTIIGKTSVSITGVR